MGIRLLGPIELRTVTGEPAELAGPKRRAVLALLAIEFNRAVPLGRFFELLWDEEPPAQARAALQGHVAALRKVLDGTAFELRTCAPGYLLTGDAGQVDLLRVEALAARAEAAPGDDRSAAVLLKQALDLWYGVPLADLPDTALCRALGDRLGETRARVLTSWAERQLRLGHGAAAVPALEQYVRGNGLREQAVALLMRCLHQDDRVPDALDAYHRARARLDEELGIAPGPALREALGAVLRDESAGRPLPYAPAPGSPGARVPGRRPPYDHPAVAAAGLALPRRPDGLVGRTAECRWLDRECGPERTGGGLAVVTGPAGVGKTAIAVRWAQDATADFPDGQLFVPLRGFDPAGPTPPGEALGRLLRALGLPESAVPDDPAARTALYREETRRRRLLVVLDDARDAAQVAALRPAGARCATVVTTRSTLEELAVTQGAALLGLDALPAAEAAELLARLLPPGRAAAEAEPARRLAALCDRLPLALRIAAARLASHPAWTIDALTTVLEEERTRLLLLDTPGDVGLRSRLTMTYRRLPWDAAQLLALLAVHPGPEVDAYAAAALLGTDMPAARLALAALTEHHLLAERAPGRYEQPGLVRAFGAELLAEQGESVRYGAAGRLLDHYQAAAEAAADPVVRRLRTAVADRAGGEAPWLQAQLS
ncbi:BTAD domain-containing putative transcriptional regulator [Kitasatospora sp. NPDC057223]|uniref:BTAD domain-containing putative transcriptional regulator n=1 Tax=Kitasatospora sp. NPDC057223 TaxID=3346055 RepID=UPI00362EFCB2